MTVFTLPGRRIRDGIQVLAALNPYRKRKNVRKEMGLTFSIGGNPQEQEMSKLVYRVKPIPPTLKVGLTHSIHSLVMGSGWATVSVDANYLSYSFCCCKIYLFIPLLLPIVCLFALSFNQNDLYLHLQ